MELPKRARSRKRRTQPRQAPERHRAPARLYCTCSGIRHFCPLMKGDDIAERLLRFAKRVLRLCREIAKDFAGKHVARQLIRCASGGGSNYEEARGAESLADFVHKMAVARKEVRESLYWLRLADGELVQGAEVTALIREANELTAILTSSVKTARARARDRTRSAGLLKRDDGTRQVKQTQVVRSDSFPSDK